jgi:hypothetical protein
VLRVDLRRTNLVTSCVTAAALEVCLSLPRIRPFIERRAPVLIGYMRVSKADGVRAARRRVAEGRVGEAGRYLDAAREAVSRAAGLTHRLLAFARRQHLDPKPVDADGLIAGLADLICRTMGPGSGWSSSCVTGPEACCAIPTSWRVRC